MTPAPEGDDEERELRVPFRPAVSAIASTRGRLATMSSRRRSGPPIRSRRSASSKPKTARMITSRVIACMLGSEGNSRSAGHAAIRRSATSSIIAP